MILLKKHMVNNNKISDDHEVERMSLLAKNIFRCFGFMDSGLMISGFMCGILMGCEGGEISRVDIPKQSPLSPSEVVENMAEEGGVGMGGVEMGGVEMGGVEPDPITCGLQETVALNTFKDEILPFLSTTCLDCHLPNSFREFKFPFETGDLPDLSEEQILDTLNACEPHITLGDSTQSALANRIIDNHADLDYNEMSPEYISVRDWINTLTPCQ